MSLIKKYAPALTVLALLMASVAAPYLIPENPDSPVFRSGTLGLILLLGCAQPVWHALTHANLRTLLCGAIWGLLFAFALGLGSELFVYNGLLPGFSSFVRRMAVPVLATPLLGALAARLMLLVPARSSAKRIPFWGFFAVILLCWTPVLLAYFPGMLNYDFVGEYYQHVYSDYSSIHPLLHSAVMNGVITLGEWIHSRTFGLLLMTVLQMGAFAASLAYGCTMVQKHGAPRWALAALTALFALHPIFSVMALSMTKDTLFVAAIMALSLETFDCICDPNAFFAAKRRCAFFIFLIVNASLMRNNGVFALALMLPALLIVLPGWRRKVLALCAGGAAASALTLAVLTALLSPTELPSFQFYSLPAQQLVRAYNSGKMQEADMRELESWYTDATGLIQHPYLADGAKGYLDRPRIAKEGEKFMELWQRVSGDCMHEYIEALLMLNVGSWYPDDLTHSTIYRDASWNDKGYLQTSEYDMAEYDLHTRSLLPSVRDLYERICRRNEYQKYPIVSQLFCTATPFWVMMFACALLVARRNTRFLSAALGALGLWLSYLFGPCTLPRYALPLFCLAPVLLSLAFILPKKELK